MGHINFTSEKKQIAMESVLLGQDVLVILPTGSGKSLIGLGPALEPEGKVSVIVVPLISLLRDQYNNIRIKGLPAKELHGKQTYAEQKAVYNKLKS